ncbi:MAG: hypothetical protein IJ055_02290 [Oscillospiraceae bacterium]|nr:hypothetical protein [Oscillospiraceae bacterium]
MEQLRTSVTSACFLSCAVAIAGMLRPGKRLDGQLRFLFALLFVVSLVSPFLSMDLTAFPAQALTVQETQTQALEEAAQAALLRNAENACAQAVTDLLLAQGITCADVHASIHIDEDGRISLTEVEAACSDPAMAVRILRDALGEGVELHAAQLVE